MVKMESEVLRVDRRFAEYLKDQAERKQMKLVPLTRWLHAQLTKKGAK
jgi:hypothetical protein